ncbi:MAG TPA: HD domain-containing protein, partial [Gemmataceae bacterium]|nr:HD domain-containing protein [Gemmataceae bacterium]
MSETQVLLSKIAALRQRLEQAQKLVSDAGSTAAALLDRDAPTTDAVAVLERKGAAGARQNAMLDSVLRQLPGNDGASESAMLPAQLTTRAARLLKRSRELLAQLRGLGDDPLLQHDEGDPLAVLHRETAAMLDTILRTVQAFPEAASAQIRLCEGLDVVLNVVADRLAVLGSALAGRRRDRERIDTLAELLTALASGQATEIAPFTALAEALIEDAQQGLPLRYLHAPAEQPARFVAAHCLMTAQVIVRLTRHDPDWRGKPLEPVLAALVHDVGMLRVPAEVLTHPGPLDDAGRRAIETHVAIGADMVAKLSPYPGPL